MVAAWQAFLTRVMNTDAPWLKVERHDGAAAVTAAYAHVLAGRGDPRTGHILSLRT
jgi:hypothetical protein